MARGRGNGGKRTRSNREYDEKMKNKGGGERTEIFTIQKLGGQREKMIKGDTEERWRKGGGNS